MPVFILTGADDGVVKRRDAARKKDSRKDRKDKGYVMFEEEDSEEELVADDAVKYVDSRLLLLRLCFFVLSCDSVRCWNCNKWTVQSYSSGGTNVHPIYRKPKMVAMATSLRTSKSAMSSSDSLTPKTNP